MPKRGVLLRLAACVCALALPACGSNDEPPTRLLDGSPAVAPPVSLDGVDGPAIAAKVAVVQRRQLTSSSAELECLRRSEDEGVGPVVVSVGTYATSFTFRAASGRALIGCDGVTAGREGARQWCGRAFGLLRHGRLRDPRLDLACDGDDGRPIAFAWVEPSPRTAYVAVEERGYVEVYDVAGGLPARVVTTDVDVSRSSASFTVSEHDRAGHLVRRYRSEPTVAG